MLSSSRIAALGAYQHHTLPRAALKITAHLCGGASWLFYRGTLAALAHARMKMTITRKWRVIITHNIIAKISWRKRVTTSRVIAALGGSVAEENNNKRALRHKLLAVAAARASP